MTLDLTRRRFLIGIGLVGIAPAIVKAGSIMRVRPVDPMDDGFWHDEEWPPFKAGDFIYVRKRGLSDEIRTFTLVNESGFLYDGLNDRMIREWKAAA